MKTKKENHDWHCLDCDEICDISEVKFDEDGEMVCPECGSDSRVMKTESNHPTIPSYDCEGRLQSESNMEALNGMGSMIGLTKREYFAAKAMQGILSNMADPAFAKITENAARKLKTSMETQIAILSVAQADALISALNTNQ